MNAKERYEVIVKTIEKLIKENEWSDPEISDKAFENAGLAFMDDRSRNVLFQFLLDKTVRDYISERKLMIAYKYLINEKDDKKAIWGAKQITNASRSYFITKMQNAFGMTPNVARKLKDPSLYKTIPTWECLSGLSEGDDSMENTKFGISKEQFVTIQKACNLQDFYSFNDYESEFAYSLFADDATDLNNAFEYVADYLGLRDTDNPDDRLEVDLGREDVKYLYFSCGFGFDAIFYILLMKYLHQFHNPVKSYDAKFLKACSDYAECLITRWNPSEPIFQDKYDFYFRSADDRYTEFDFELYILYLQFYDYKKAFSMINPGIQNEEELNEFKLRYGKSMPVLSREEREERDYYDKYQIEMEEEYYSTAPEYENAYEPEIWDDDFVTGKDTSAVDEFLADEDDWVAPETEGYDPDLNLRFDDFEYENFDLEAFDQLCDEMSDDQSVPEIKRKPNKRFFVFKDLDVESFGEMLLNRSTESELPFK